MKAPDFRTKWPSVFWHHVAPLFWRTYCLRLKGTNVGHQLPDDKVAWPKRPQH